VFRRLFRRMATAVVALAVVASVAGCSSGSTKKAAEHLTPVPAHCEPLAAGGCLLPFPSDAFTVADPSTPTGRRLAFDPSVMLKNASGTAIDPTEWNRADGFGPGSAIIVATGPINATAHLAGPGDIGASLAADAPIVLLDATTRTRHPYWVDVNQGVITVRPARALVEQHRYVVGLRRFTATGWPAFDAIRDRHPTDQPAVEARRPAVERAISDLGTAGVGRADVALAWDFTVASSATLAGRLLHIRDDAFGSLNGGAPTFHVDRVEQSPAPDLTRRVTGTFTVPRYLTGDGGVGQRFSLGPAGLPVRNGDQQANFICLIPKAAASRPAAGVVYGHGLLGSAGEVNALATLAQRGDAVLCATDWIGMSSADLTNLVTVLGDLSRFPTVVDRLQQGILHTLFLARLLKDQRGFASDPAFQLGGRSALASGEVRFNGNSQGGILGGAATAVSTEWTRAVLGVPGMNFSTLIPRSVDFAPLITVFDAAYPAPADRAVVLSLMQMLWDRGEADGYAQHMTDRPYPGTPAHTVLMIEAFGDHQVANVATQVEARTIGARVHQPALAAGRAAGDPFFGVDPIPVGDYPGSALVVWDYGTPAPPDGAVAPAQGNDPHAFGALEPRVAQQAIAFLDGRFVDVCNGQPCQSSVSG
jgi:hypothetical protein